ncbi:hypothetical protein [Hyphomicrobium sp.]|uniref:hypothetical protein n=1 Tax=Hyphomicrobium sp. TaxID=82 RepID=UPI003569A817
MLDVEKTEHQEALRLLLDVQERDRQHPTLKVIFTVDGLAVLHDRELYAFQGIHDSFMRLLPMVWAREQGERPSEYRALDRQHQNICNERHAIRQHIENAKRALEPALFMPMRPAAMAAPPTGGKDL